MSIIVLLKMSYYLGRTFFLLNAYIDVYYSFFTGKFQSHWRGYNIGMCKLSCEFARERFFLTIPNECIAYKKLWTFDFDN